MGKKTPLKDLSTEDLKANLKKIKIVHGAILAIFGIILLAWVVLGHWRENPPLFISTVVMTGAIFAALAASRSGLVRELKKREQSSLPNEIPAASGSAAESDYRS